MCSDMQIDMKSVMMLDLLAAVSFCADDVGNVSEHENGF